MPLGIVNDDEFFTEKKNSCDFVNVTDSDSSKPFKNKYDKFQSSIDVNNDSAVSNDSNVSNSIESDNSNKERRAPYNPMSPISIEIMPRVGRDNDVPNVPQSLRKIIGEDAAVNGLQSAMHLASSFGISQPTTSAYKRGEISPNNKTEQARDLENYIAGRKTKISKKALNKLNLALTYIDEGKLEGCDALQLSNVAKNMASVASQMTPTSDESKTNPVQFHFYAPQVKTENHYETVVAKDNY